MSCQNRKKLLIHLKTVVISPLYININNFMKNSYTFQNKKFRNGIVLHTFSNLFNVWLNERELDS